MTGFGMKKTTCRLLLAAVILSGCADRDVSSEAGDTTQTVAPAAAQPSPTGTDAMTQTVNVEDGRSEDEGAAASDHYAGKATVPVTSTGATTAAAGTTTTATSKTTTR